MNKIINQVLRERTQNSDDQRKTSKYEDDDNVIWERKKRKGRRPKEDSHSDMRLRADGREEGQEKPAEGQQREKERNEMGWPSPKEAKRSVSRLMLLVKQRAQMRW